MPKSKKQRQDYGDEYNYNDDFANISSKSPKSKSSKKKIAVNTSILVISLIFIIIGSILLYMNNMLGLINYNANSSKSSQSEDEDQMQHVNQVERPDGSLLRDPMILNVAVFGINEGLSDTIMLVSVDSRHQKLKIISFQRDTWVGKRLNAFFAKGVEYAVQALQQNFGVKIDRTVSVDFAGFEKSIDTIGGIYIPLTVPEIKYINEFSKDYKHTLPIKEGLTHLTGKQALCHARNRNNSTTDENGKTVNNDYARTSRQRKVAKILIDTFKSLNITQIMELAKQLLPNVTTNFEKSKLLALAPKAKTYMGYPIKEMRLPSDDNVQSSWEGRALVEKIPDWRKARRDLAEFIFEELVE